MDLLLFPVELIRNVLAQVSLQKSWFHLFTLLPQTHRQLCWYTLQHKSNNVPQWIYHYKHLGSYVNLLRECSVSVARPLSQTNWQKCLASMNDTQERFFVHKNTLTLHNKINAQKTDTFAAVEPLFIFKFAAFNQNKKQQKEITFACFPCINHNIKKFYFHSKNSKCLRDNTWISGDKIFNQVFQNNAQENREIKMHCKDMELMIMKVFVLDYANKFAFKPVLNLQCFYNDVLNIQCNFAKAFYRMELCENGFTIRLCFQKTATTFYSKNEVYDLIDQQFCA